VSDLAARKILPIEFAKRLQKLFCPTNITGVSSLHIPSNGFSKQRRAYSLVAVMLACAFGYLGGGAVG
jgi:hypothetical protein